MYSACTTSALLLYFHIVIVVLFEQPERIDPPEGCKGFGIKSDVWSFGITMVSALIRKFVKTRFNVSMLVTPCVNTYVQPRQGVGFTPCSKDQPITYLLMKSQSFVSESLKRNMKFCSKVCHDCSYSRCSLCSLWYY